MNTIRSILHHAIQQLVSPTSRLDAEVLLCHVLKVNRAYLYTWQDKVLITEYYQQFQDLLAKRIQGQPIAYLTGEKEFWSLSFQVTPATLIPRPETELLVEQALLRLPNEKVATVIDLGTGCGAIALAILHQRPDLTMIAVDCDAETLKIAQSNAVRLHLTQIKFLQSHWFTNLPHVKADMIVSNPPYIADSDPHMTQGDVRYEPRHALTSGYDGLTAIRHIIAQASHFLAKQGWLLLEHGYDQADVIRQLLQQHRYQQIETYRDLAGLERVTVGQV